MFEYYEILCTTQRYCVNKVYNRKKFITLNKIKWKRKIYLADYFKKYKLLTVITTII